MNGDVLFWSALQSTMRISVTTTHPPSDSLLSVLGDIFYKLIAEIDRMNNVSAQETPESCVVS